MAMVHLSQTNKRHKNAENLIWILWPRRVLLWKLSQVDLYGDSLGPWVCHQIVDLVGPGSPKRVV